MFKGARSTGEIRWGTIAPALAIRADPPGVTFTWLMG
jgi:hypothetical protein